MKINPLFYSPIFPRIDKDLLKDLIKIFFGFLGLCGLMGLLGLCGLMGLSE